MVTKKSKIKLVSSNPKPQSKFDASGQALWESIQGEFDVSDAGGTALLTQICHAQDRVTQLAEQIAIDGVTIYVKGVPKAHPALRDELQGRAFICRSLQRLGVNVEAVKNVGRPPGAGWSG